MPHPSARSGEVSPVAVTKALVVKRVKVYHAEFEAPHPRCGRPFPEEEEVMVKIRLMRMGAKKNPHYRVVVVDSRKKRSSDYIESLGYYDPRDTTPEPLKIDTERANYWLSQGAQPTETTVRLLEKVGVEVPMVQAKRTEGYRRRTADQA